MNIYDVIRADLTSLSIQTELLELFDWDSDRMEKFTRDVGKIINGLMVVQDNYNLQLSRIREKIAEISDETVADLIIKLIRNHEKEIIEFEKEKSN